MRALCGAIITAGAVIGLGLTAVGIGNRYQNVHSPQVVDEHGNTTVTPYLVNMHSMDRPLVFCLVFLTCVAIVGLGIAFVGLAYHHHRRYHEMVAAGHIPPHHHVPASPGSTGIQSPPPM